MTSQPHRLRLTLLATAALLGLGAVASQASVPQSDPGTGSMSVPVDRQFYVTSSTTHNPNDGSTVDAYDADPSSIHVAVNGGSEFARSFVHLALDYLPAHAVATQVTMTLHITAQSDASNTGVYPLYNVNTSAAIVEACALTSELPSKFDDANPPKYDCEHGSAVGKPNKAGDVWTFQLENLVAYWKVHGNTGAALVPIAADPSQTWAVAFYKSRSSSRVAYAIPPVTHVRRPAANSGPTTTGTTSTGSESSGTVAPPASSAAGAPPANPTVVPPQASTLAPNQLPPSFAATSPALQTQASTQRPDRGPTSHWPWVLLGCLALTAGSLGVAHRTQLAAFIGRIGAPTIGAFRAHPRAYTVAAAASAWGLVFSGYSLVVQPANAPSQNAASVAGQQGGSTPLSPGAQPGVLPNGKLPTNTVVGGSRSGATVSSTTQTGPGVTTPVSNPAVTEFKGAGTWRTINGVRVFFPADGSTPVADLYHGADDTIGLTPDSIRLCTHAALTYGSAFHISASDLDVYWSWLNDHGGIYGRKVVTNYVNDNYDPGTAVQAAQTCKDWQTFMLLGGIGFDQIPAVRQWAEQNHMLYLHHVATTENTDGLRYSYSALPSVEELGKQMGEIAKWKFPNAKVGIIYRNSSNWSPGVKTFEAVLKAAGIQVVGSYPVTINQGNYTQEIAQLQAKGANLVFAWENALSSIEIIKQAQGQNYHPAWLVAAFNIITNTLGDTAMDQDIWGAAAWDAYDPNYYGGGFAGYAADIKEFEAEYKHYDPNADLSGDGGDLLFGAWESWRLMADLLKRCGPACTRNKMAGLLLAGYHHTVSPNCDVDFAHSADHHHGGYLFNALHVEKDPNGRANFVPVQRCLPQLGAGG
jgi:ABC-type branched-subunit amino acid transport system substrate-binding protein